MADEHDQQEGATTGGAAKGGSAQEGAATEGAATGGAVTEGAATGGAMTGGAATGDAAMGGAKTEGATTGGAPTPDQPSEEEMRAAYEAELNRITSSEMILQTAVSLLNIGGRRLGLAGPPTGSPNSDRPAPGSSASGSSAGGERDLEQVRDAIDGVRALMPILERRMSRELGPLRDAIAQLQMAYAREVRVGGDTESSAAQAPPPGQVKPAGNAQEPKTGGQPEGPGPAQASGRLWVPGR